MQTQSAVEAQQDLIDQANRTEEEMDWHIDTRGHACACIEQEHDERPRISYAQATALDEWDRKTERTG